MVSSLNVNACILDRRLKVPPCKQTYLAGRGSLGHWQDLLHFHILGDLKDTVITYMSFTVGCFLGFGFTDLGSSSMPVTGQLVWRRGDGWAEGTVFTMRDSYCRKAYGDQKRFD